MSLLLISDLHLGHTNCINKINEMYGLSLDCDSHCELLIENCRKVVHKKDVLGILGDTCMEKPNEYVDRFFQNVPGMKWLVPGNHDTWKVIKYLMDQGYIYKVFGCMKHHDYMFTHIPIMVSEISIPNKRFYLGNVHGHIHDAGKNALLDKSMYFNVCANLNNFTPVEFEFIRKTIGVENEIHDR